MIEKAIWLEKESEEILSNYQQLHQLNGVTIIGDLMKTLALSILKSVSGAYWDHKELIVRIRGQEEVIAKIEDKSLKTTTGNYKVHRRLSFKPKIFTSDKLRSGYKTAQDFDKAEDLEVIRQEAEVLSLYAYLYPTFKAYENEIGSYSEYVKDKNSFVEDFKRFATLEPSKLLATLKYIGIHPKDPAAPHKSFIEYLVSEPENYSLHSLMLAADKVTIKGDTTMDRKPTRREKSMAMAKKALVMGTVTAANKQLVSMAVDSLGPNAPDILKTEAGQHALQILIPFVLMHAVDLDFTGKYIPEKIRAQFIYVCEEAFTGALASGSEAFATEIFGLLGPVIGEYTKAAEAISLPDMGEEELDAMPLGAHTREREMSKVL